MTTQADRLDEGWVWPLSWILVAPVVTVPLTWIATGRVMQSGACVTQTTVGFIGDSFVVCQSWALLLALAPGVLNLVPILWLLSRSRKTRIAAFAATALGSARLLFPAGTLLWAGPTEEFGTWFSEFPSFPNENSGAVLVVSTSLWLLGGGVLVVMALVHPRPRLADMPGRGQHLGSP